MELAKFEILKEFEQVKGNNALNIKKFPSGIELMKYFGARIRSAKIVYDLSWSENYSSFHDLKENTDAHYEFEATVNELTDNLVYKEIFIFSEEGRKKKCLSRLSQKNPGYSCRYYKSVSVPRVQFAIIDKEEIIWGYPDKHGDYTINNPILAKILCDYFEEAWDKARRIKEGKIIDEREFEKIKCMQNE